MISRCWNCKALDTLVPNPVLGGRICLACGAFERRTEQHTRMRMYDENQADWPPRHLKPGNGSGTPMDLKGDDDE